MTSLPAEEARIQEAYKRRAVDNRYSWFQQDQVLRMQQLELTHSSHAAGSRIRFI